MTTGIEIIDRFNEFLRRAYRERPLPQPYVLEAGGGSFTYFCVPEGSRLVALDISRGQLVRNQSTALRVQGDLQAFPISRGKLGMIICFNVIEHLGDPESALRQMIGALDGGGLMLLGCPNRQSLKGLITRVTPFRLHGAFYRYVAGKKDRGEGHYDCFPTPFGRVVSEGELPGWLAGEGMDIVEFRAYDGAAAYRLTTGNALRRLISIPYYALATLLDHVTGGKCGGPRSDMLLIARKKGGNGA